MGGSVSRGRPQDAGAPRAEGPEGPGRDDAQRHTPACGSKPDFGKVGVVGRGGGNPDFADRDAFQNRRCAPDVVPIGVRQQENIDPSDPLRSKHRKDRPAARIGKAERWPGVDEPRSVVASHQGRVPLPYIQEEHLCATSNGVIRPTEQWDETERSGRAEHASDSTLATKKDAQREEGQHGHADPSGFRAERQQVRALKRAGKLETQPGADVQRGAQEVGGGGCDQHESRRKKPHRHHHRGEPGDEQEVGDDPEQGKR
jgi:hypothetical protein